MSYSNAIRYFFILITPLPNMPAAAAAAAGAACSDGIAKNSSSPPNSESSVAVRAAQAPSMPPRPRIFFQIFVRINEMDAVAIKDGDRIGAGLHNCSSATLPPPPPA